MASYTIWLSSSKEIKKAVRFTDDLNIQIGIHKGTCRVSLFVRNVQFGLEKFLTPYPILIEFAMISRATEPTEASEP